MFMNGYFWQFVFNLLELNKSMLLIQLYEVFFGEVVSRGEEGPVENFKSNGREVGVFTRLDFCDFFWLVTCR